MKKNVNVNGNVNNGTTTFMCPVCNTVFAIPNHQHMVTGMAIGKDSGLGVVHPVVEKVGSCSVQPTSNFASVPKSKAQAKIDALRSHGYDTSNLFAILGGGNSDGYVGRNVNGAITIIADDDPIFAEIANEIYEEGDVNNTFLFRRWALAQYLYGETCTSWYSGERIGFTKYIHRKGYDYSMKTLCEDYIVQSRLLAKAEREVNEGVRNRIMDDFYARNRWNNQELGVLVINHDIKMTHKFVDNAKVRHCNGKEYKCIRGRNIFVTEIEEKVFQPLYTIRDKFAAASTIAECANLLKHYMSIKVNLDWTTSQCPSWVDAYKGVGAYYNMRNLIMFHGCRIHNEDGITLSREESLKDVEDAAIRFANGAGWCMLGKIRQLLRDNNIDIEAMRNEWRTRK